MPLTFLFVSRFFSIQPKFVFHTNNFFAVVAENTRFFTISFAPPVWLFFFPDQWEEDRKRAMSAVSQVFFPFFFLYVVIH